MHAKYRHGLRHALTFLRDVHRDPATGGYAWALKWQDGTGATCSTAPIIVMASPSSCWLMPMPSWPAKTPRGPISGGDLRSHGDSASGNTTHGLYADEASARLVDHLPLSRAERQYACLRSDAGGFRGDQVKCAICTVPKPWRYNITERQAALGQRHDVGALPRRLVGRLGLQQRRQDQHLPPLGLSAGPSHRMGEAAAHPGAVQGASQRPGRLVGPARQGFVRHGARQGLGS